MAIQDLKEGMSVSMHALVVEKKNAVAKNGKPYADLVVSDKTGKLKCKIWNYADENEILVVGKPVLIDVNVGSYNGELQGVINSFMASDMDIMHLVKSSRFKVEELLSFIEETIGEFAEPLTKHVALKLINRSREKFLKAPAATGVHNAWYGGLVEHTWSMLKLAKPIVEHYKLHYGVKLSTDKVYFGTIFHDIGKCEEYSISNPAFPKTADGVLVNHIVMGPAVIYEMCNKAFESDPACFYSEEDFVRERSHLMHLVASHHGKIEFGSPVVPSTLEAVLLHQLDLLDSQFMHALELVEGKEGPIAGFSEKSWVQRTQFMK